MRNETFTPKTIRLQKFCTFVAVLHLLSVSLATLIGALVIESILLSGFICLVIALAGFPFSLACARYWLAAVLSSTLLTGAFFTIFELCYGVLGGPENAALPLCLLFLGVQGFAVIATTIDFNNSTNRRPQEIKQISLWQLLTATGLFAVSFGAIENFPLDSVPFISNWSVAFRFPWLVSLCLAMNLLTVFGCITLYRNGKVSRTEMDENAS